VSVKVRYLVGKVLKALTKRVKRDMMITGSLKALSEQRSMEVS